MGESGDRAGIKGGVMGVSSPWRCPGALLFLAPPNVLAAGRGHGYTQALLGGRVIGSLSAPGISPK